jgi:ATP-dependent phosphoenolpyruvate carboxykinase
LKYSRAIIDAIHSGELAKAEYVNYPVFNLSIPKKCSKVPDEVLDPSKTWMGAKEDYEATLKKLGKLFADNFKNYADKASKEIANAGPVI